MLSPLFAVRLFRCCCRRCSRKFLYRRFVVVVVVVATTALVGVLVVVAAVAGVMFCRCCSSWCCCRCLFFPLSHKRSVCHAARATAAWNQKTTIGCWLRGGCKPPEAGRVHTAKGWSTEVFPSHGAALALRIGGIGNFGGGRLASRVAADVPCAALVSCVRTGLPLPTRTQWSDGHLTDAHINPMEV